MNNSQTPEYATTWQSACERPRGTYNTLRWQARHFYLETVSRIPSSRSGRGMLKCLCCHYVFDNQVRKFESILLQLKKIGTFVTAQECLEMAQGARSIDATYFHLSFDDGFRNIVSNAVPILRRHSIPASYFIPTSYIGGDYRSAKAFCQREKYQHPIEFATWDDLKRLDFEWMTIGSHTKTHPRLHSISSDRLRLASEMTDSKEIIEQQLGRPCTLLAWPGGQPHDIDEVSLEAARRAGYTAAFGASGGVCCVERADPFVIPRQHFEVQWPIRHINYLATCR